jgi:hypothetical protein
VFVCVSASKSVSLVPPAAPVMRQSPGFRLRYCHRLLAEVAQRGPVDLKELFREVDVEQLFGSERLHRAPLERARQLARYARDLGLLGGDGDQLEITRAGKKYVAAGDASDVFAATTEQAAILRDQIAAEAPAGGLARGAALALSLMASADETYTSEDLGRALGLLGGMSQWREVKTFESQADRFKALLEDARLIDSAGNVAPEGRSMLDRVNVSEHPALRDLARASRSSGSSDAISAGARVWLVRAGREGRYEQLAIEDGVTVIGWSELGEFGLETSRDALKAQIEEVYGEHRPQSLAMQAGQIHRFIHDISMGDLLVLPLLSKPGYAAIGRVLGGYKHRDDGSFEGTDAQHTRPVEWLASELPDERFDPDLREAFGQQGTVSEISKPNAAQRIIDVLNGADASAIHLVLKWSPNVRPDTIDRHKEVVDAKGSVWWGRLSKPSTTGLGADWLAKLRKQLDDGSETLVFLHGSASTWRTRLLAVATDAADVDDELIPAYYDPQTFHSLWVRIADFEHIEPSEITDGYVLAQSGDPVTAGGLGNQTPLIIRKQSGTLPGRFFILNQGQADQPYDDTEGERYHWTSNSSGAWKQLSNSPGARFVYYRPGKADDGTSRTYFGMGRIASVITEERDGLQHFMAAIEDFEAFDKPVSWEQGPNRNAQTSIQPNHSRAVRKAHDSGRKRTADVELRPR